jgi:hypothetical protein
MFVTRRARGRAIVMRVARALVACTALAGCGGGDRDASSLEFIEIGDSAETGRGRPLLTGLEPYRMENGAVRVRGRIDMPDRTRLQVSIERSDTREIVGRVQVRIVDRAFDTPPILGPSGPLPKGRYRVEAYTLFNPVWQEPDVMRKTDDGRRIKGVGMTLDQAGDPGYRVVVERDL